MPKQTVRMCPCQGQMLGTSRERDSGLVLSLSLANANVTLAFSFLSWKMIWLSILCLDIHSFSKLYMSPCIALCDGAFPDFPSFRRKEGGSLSWSQGKQTPGDTLVKLMTLWIVPYSTWLSLMMLEFCWSSTEGKDKDARGDSRDSVKTACIPSTEPGNLHDLPGIRWTPRNVIWPNFLVLHCRAERYQPLDAIGKSTCVVSYGAEGAWWSNWN